MARSSALLIFLLQLSRNGLASAQDECTVTCERNGNGANSKLLCKDDCGPGLECITTDLQADTGDYTGTCHDTFCNGPPPGRGGNAEAQDEGIFRVTICHRTCSETNPWVRITIDEDAWFDPNCGHQQHDAQLDCNLDNYSAWGGRTEDYLIKTHRTRQDVRDILCTDESDDCAALERAYWRKWEKACPSASNGECCGDDNPCCGEDITSSPTGAPSFSPSEGPSSAPSEGPTGAPSSAPSEGPTAAPSSAPSEGPTAAPSSAPSEVPTRAPSTSPSDIPSTSPSSMPSGSPSDAFFANQCELVSAEGKCPWTSAFNTTVDFGDIVDGLVAACSCSSVPNVTCTDNDSCKCVVGVISTEASICGGNNNCNCVKGGIAESDVGNVCGGTKSCNYNYGDIDATGGNTCKNPRGCNCNSCNIKDACGSNDSCNFNSGLIEGGDTKACSCEFCCNFNGWDGGDSVGSFDRTCTYAEITAPGCGENSCNCNRGRIVGTACSSGGSCNNVPTCLEISAGCDNTGDCNFLEAAQAACDDGETVFKDYFCATSSPFQGRPTGTFSYCTSAGVCTGFTCST